MQVFHCDHCQQLVFFENTRCVNCERTLAFLPDLGFMGSLDPAGGDRWRSPLPVPQGRLYRLCANYSRENVCNWAIPESEPDSLCVSCRLTRVIPDLGQAGYREAWYKLEVAKRRVIYSLIKLGCPLTSKADDPQHGLAFEFKSDPAAAGFDSILTGHAGGVITLNIAEANDAERERLRLQLHEPYRTLLGHFRHEVGHYYWERLISRSPRLQPFRVLFGDETAHYGEALQNHYWQGPPPDWQNRYVSAYASAHPWEDWAETWAHYLHMTDTLETAAACGLSLRPRRRDEPELKSSALPRDPALSMFDEVIESWFPLTYVLNNLNRGLGLPDGYPFVLSNAAIDKLRFVHETIAAAAFHQESPGTSDTAGTGKTALQDREPAKREA